MLSADDISDLGATLSGAGFKVSIQQYLAAQRIVTHLRNALSGADPHLRLITLFSPIFCTNAEEQDRFGQIYTKWLYKRFGTNLPDSVEAVTPISSFPARHAIALTLALFSLAVVGWFFWQDLRERTYHGRVILERQAVGHAKLSMLGRPVESEDDGRFLLTFRANEMPATLSVKLRQDKELEQTIGEEFTTSRRRLYLDGTGRQTEFPLEDLDLSRAVTRPQPPIVLKDPSEQTRQRFEALNRFDVRDIIPPLSWWQRINTRNAALIALLLVPAIGGMIYRKLRKPVLQRLATQTPQSLHEVHITRRQQSFFPALPLRRLAQALRSRTSTESASLDVERTAYATARAAGLFTAVYGSRFEPGYLALIDSYTRDDHEACFASHIVTDLRGSDVSLEQFEFSQDPRLLQPIYSSGEIKSKSATAVTTMMQAITLDELYARYPHRRLLIFADADFLFDGFTGRPYPWLEDLGRWHERYLFTVKELGLWSRAEWLIEKSGIRILPLSPSGLVLFSELLQGSESAPSRVPAQDVVQPLYERRRHRWLEREGPPDAEVRRLCDGLERDLGPDTFTWLSACAAYPEIVWGLTLRLGTGLLGQGERFVQSLTRLAQLIWFREAFMPDWLRIALLQRLPIAQWKKVTNLLTKILSTVGESNQTFGLWVGVGSSSSRQARGIRGIIARWFSRQKAKVQAQEIIAEAPKKSPLGDFVFLQFLSGKRPERFTPGVPRVFLRALFRQGHPWLGFRSYILMLAVVSSIVVLGLILPPIDPPDSREFTVRLVSPSADGKTFAALEGNGNVILWDTARGPEVITHKQGKQVDHIALRPDGKLVALQHPDGRITLWDPIGEYRSRELNVSSRVGTSGLGIQFGNQETLLSFFKNSSGEGMEFVKWDLSKDSFAPFPLPRLNITAATMAVDGQTVAFGTSDGNVEVYEPVGRNRTQLPTKNTTPLTELSYSSDGLRLAALHQDGAIDIWDMTSRTILATMAMLRGSSDTSPRHIALSPDGTFLAASTDDELRLWTTADGGGAEGLLKPFSDAISSIAFSNDGKTLVAAGFDGMIQIWALPQRTIPRQSRSVALLIGNNSVEVSLSLPGLITELKNVGDQLAKLGFQVFLLDEPSHEQIDGALEQLIQKLRPNDRLLLFLAGHSSTDEAGDFLFGKARDSNPSIYEYSGSELAERLSQMRASEILVIIDASFANLPSKLAPATTPNTTLRRSRMLLASTSNDVAHHSVDGGPFGIALTRLLGDMKRTTSGSQFARDLVSKMKATEPVQHPSYGPFLAAGHTAGDFHFILPKDERTRDVPPNYGYAYYASSTERYFRKISGDPTGEPKPGDIVEATRNVNIRKGYIEFQGSEWVNKESIGILRPGARVKVAEVKSFGGFIWIAFERLLRKDATGAGGGPTETPTGVPMIPTQPKATPTKTISPTPDWVSRGASAASKQNERAFYGVGTITGVRNELLAWEVTKSRASDDIIQQMEAYVELLLKDYTSSLEGKSVAPIFKDITLKTLRRPDRKLPVTAADQYKDDSKNTYYVLMKLNLKDVVEVLESRSSSKEFRGFVKQNAERIFDERLKRSPDSDGAIRHTMNQPLGTRSLRASNLPNHFVRHRHFLIELSEIREDLDQYDASFTIVPGVADSAGISFESVNYPGHYLRHQDFRLKLAPASDDSLFKADATFYIVPGLADQTKVSFRSSNFPDRYMRHRNFEVVLDPDTGPPYREDATFILDAPFKLKAPDAAPQARATDQQSDSAKLSPFTQAIYREVARTAGVSESEVSSDFKLTDYTQKALVIKNLTPVFHGDFSGLNLRVIKTAGELANSMAREPFSILNSVDPINLLMKYGWSLPSDNYYQIGYYILATHENVNNGRPIILTREFDIRGLMEENKQWQERLMKIIQECECPILAIDRSYYDLYFDDSIKVGGKLYLLDRTLSFYQLLREWHQALPALFNRNDVN
ncbi:AbfB domain-containing protein [Nitrospira sp. Nam80]